MSDLLAMWSAAGFAAVLAGWRFWRLMSARVHVAGATAILAKMVKADPARAIKLCLAAPRAVYMIAVREALAAPPDASSREARQLRFDQALARALAPLESRRWMDLAALAAGSIATVIAATAASVDIPVLLLAAAAAVVSIRNLRALRRLRREPIAAFPTLLEVIAAGASPEPIAAPASVGPAPTATGTVLVLTASICGAPVGAIALDRDVVKIGKLPSSHLRLDHDSVSRMHAVVETSSEGSVIIDLGATRGTRVNGEKVNKAVLSVGDELRLGDVIIKVSTGPGTPVTTPPAPVAPPAEGTATIFDLRNGMCPLCRGTSIEQRPPVAGDFVPWVCEGCGYAQLFARPIS